MTKFNDKRDSVNFCPIPFMQLQLNPMGNVSACCFSGEHKVGDIHTQTIEEIWNGEEMQKWRKEFLTGDIKICEHAMKNFECHKMAQYLNEHAVLDVVQKSGPKRLDLRLNGMCNLECIMCEVWKEPNHLYDKSDFWSYGSNNFFTNLIEVFMLGGEPFIQKDTFRMINEVSQVNPNCRFSFITNCSYHFNPHLQSHLDKISIGSIHMSIDSLNPETYSKIRIKGDLTKTLDTAEKFIAYRNERRKKNRDFTLFASMCVQVLNWTEIPDFLEFCLARDVKPIFQSVIGKSEISLKNLEKQQLQELRKTLEPYLNNESRQAVLPVFNEIESVLASIS